MRARLMMISTLLSFGLLCVACGQPADKAAVKAAGIEASIEKVEKIQDIMKFGVMITPALVLDGQVKVVGKIPTPEAIAEWLK